MSWRRFLKLRWWDGEPPREIAAYLENETVPRRNQGPRTGRKNEAKWVWLPCDDAVLVSYSCRNASIGSMRAARLLGMSPDTAETSASASEAPA